MGFLVKNGQEDKISLITVYYSLFTVHCSLFTVCQSHLNSYAESSLQNS